MIAKGAPIRYLGATGPVEFDANGDVSGPALAWRVEGSNLVIDRSFSAEDMQALFKQVDG